MTEQPQDAMKSLRAKYPQYNNIPDAELAQKIVAKYPTYKDAFAKYLQPQQAEPSFAQTVFGENSPAGMVQRGIKESMASPGRPYGNPAAGAFDIAGGALSVPFLPLSVAGEAAKQIPVVGQGLSSVLNAPGAAIAWLVNQGRNAIQGGLNMAGVPQSVQNLGLPQKMANEASAGLQNVNQATAAYLLAPTLAARGTNKAVELEGKRQANAQAKQITTAQAEIKKVAPPKPTELTYDQQLQRATPYIAEQARLTPLSAKSDVSQVRQATNLLADAKNRLWNEKISPIIEEHGAETINGNQVAQKIRSNISEYTRRTNPVLTKTIEDYADSFTGEIPIKQANEFITELNAKTAAYQKSPPIQQTLLENANPKIGSEATAVEALRQAVYDKLGPDVAELKKDYGSLAQIHKAMERKIVSAEKDATSASFYGKPFGTAVATGATLEGFMHAPTTTSIAGITGLIRKTILERNKPNPTVSRAIGRLGKTDLIPRQVDVPGATEPQGNWGSQATALGVKFNGMQPMGSSTLPMFTDPVTGSTFVKTPNETLQQAIARKRTQFGVQ